MNDAQSAASAWWASTKRGVGFGWKGEWGGEGGQAIVENIKQQRTAVVTGVTIVMLDFPLLRSKMTSALD